MALTPMLVVLEDGTPLPTLVLLLAAGTTLVETLPLLLQAGLVMVLVQALKTHLATGLTKPSLTLSGR